MTWMKLETLVRSNPKIGATVAETGHCDAAWLWLAANTYSRDALTDGYIADFVIPTLIPALPAKVLKALPDVLVRCGLWHREADGYRVHDFLHHNPTKAEIEDKRQKDRDRKRGGIHEDSARNPDGVQVASASHARESAGARSSASYSGGGGSTSVIEGTPEGGTGEGRRVGVAGRARVLGLVSPADFERQHGRHALRGDLCGSFVCLPVSLFEDWIGRLTGAGMTRERAEADIRSFVQHVRTAWAGKVPGDDNFAFWRNEWAKQFGSNRPAAVAAPAAGLDALISGSHGR